MGLVASRINVDHERMIDPVEPLEGWEEGGETTDESAKKMKK